MKILTATVYALLFIGIITPLPAKAQEAEQAQDNSSIQSTTYEKSVVMLMVVQQEYDYRTPWKKSSMGRGTGSGFIIDDRRILTNAHNVANHRYIEVKKQNQAKRYPARVEFVGHDCDLAIVRIDDPAFYQDTEPLEFGSIPQSNSTVQTCGFPVGGRTVSITEGVVSRVEVGIYSHSQADGHLLVQTDAAINPGNSGGPVLQDGKVVGVAFQGLQAADNIGFMIPTPVINHFLKDIEDGTYDGFGSLGVITFPGLHSVPLGQYLKVPEGTGGVVVLDTILNSTVEKILKKNDVITKIDGFDIDNDGMIWIHGLNLDMSEAVEQKQIGESMDIVFYRDGHQHTASVQVNADETVITLRREFDVEPEYKCYAGLTFVSVNRNYLETWGRGWIMDVPFYLRYLFYDVQQLNDDPDRKEYIVLSEILPDETNSYSSGFVSQVLESVNGIPIRKLEDLEAGFATDQDGFWVIKFLGNPASMIIDAEKARQRHAMILEKYQVPHNALPEVTND